MEKVKKIWWFFICFWGKLSFLAKKTQKTGKNWMCRYRAIYRHFSQKNWIFPQNARAYRALFWLFCPLTHCVFTPKILKKLIFPQIALLIKGTLLTFLPKNVIFSSKFDCTSCTILTFYPIIECVFPPKIPKKLIFPQIANIIQGTLLAFCPIIYRFFRTFKPL